MIYERIHAQQIMKTHESCTAVYSINILYINALRTRLITILKSFFENLFVSPDCTSSVLYEELKFIISSILKLEALTILKFFFFLIF